MAGFDSADFKVQFRGHFQGQQWEVGQWYFGTGVALITASAQEVAEAIWNDVKTAFRATLPTSADLTIESLVLGVDDPLGAFGEFAVPPGEQQGTLSPTGLGDFLPSFNAVGIRQTVSSRLTRPGQKRFVGLMEGEVVGQLLGSGTVTLFNALGVKFSSSATLGAPAALAIVQPEIVHLDKVTHRIARKQPVSGYVTNPYVTSQVSRKQGRGS